MTVVLSRSCTTSIIGKSTQLSDLPQRKGAFSSESYDFFLFRVPGPLQIRPNLETQQRKVSQMEIVEAFYGCIDDFIYDLVFEFKVNCELNRFVLISKEP